MLIDGPVKQTILLGTDGQAVDVDSDGGLATRNKVWNPNTLAWESMKQTEVTVGALTVSGVAVSNWPSSQTVNVDNFPASQAVTGTFYPETQPVSVASLPLPSGAATSVSQESLNSLIETLQELVSRLAVLASWQQSSAAAIRVYNAGGTYTVSGPATSAQVIAALLTQTKALEQYSANAVHSNINNATGA